MRGVWPPFSPHQIEEVMAACKGMRDQLVHTTAELREVVVDRDYIRQQRDAGSAELAFLREQYNGMLARERAYVQQRECSQIPPIP